MGGFHGRIGVGRRDITPPEGIYARSWGAAEHDVADRVHRPLTATVLAFVPEPDAPPFLMAALDLGWWSDRDDEAFVRSALADGRVGPERIWVNLSHTHAGPSVCRADADRPGGSLIADYLERVWVALGEAKDVALANAAPARCEWTTGRCSLAARRDLPEPGGEPGSYVIGWNPDEPADDTLVVGRIAGVDGRTIAAIVHYACHPTTLGPANTAISPDWVGAMREVVEARIGAPVLFLQGASGDLAPRWQYVGDTAVADAHGREVGYAALAAWEGMAPPGTALAYARRIDSGAALGVWEPAPEAATSVLTAARVEVLLARKARVTAVLDSGDDRAARERRRRAEFVRRLVGDEPVVPVSLSLARIGDTWLCGVPGEAYSAFAAELRAALPGRRVLACNVTNGWLGYFPPRTTYALGELYAAVQSPFAPGCHEALVAAAVDRLKAL